MFLKIYLSLENIIYYNNKRFDTYINYCPFTLSSDLFPNNSSYFETKRCQLYNIYNNSRYKYQYICSYNPYEDLKNEKTKDGLQKIQCAPKINDQNSIKIIDEFIKIYKNKNIIELFYCNLVEMPIKNEFVTKKICNNKGGLYHRIYSLFLITHIIDLIFKFLYVNLVNYMQAKIEEEILNLIERVNRIKEENCSTDNDESNSNNVSFIEEDEINMIVENNTVHNLDMNITDSIEKEKKEKQD